MLGPSCFFVIIRFAYQRIVFGDLRVGHFLSYNISISVVLVWYYYICECDVQNKWYVGLVGVV